MSSDFFEPMSPEEWEKYKEKARKHDEQEFAYAHGALPLTGEDLHAMIDAEKRFIRESLQKVFELNQEKQGSSSSLLASMLKEMEALPKKVPSIETNPIYQQCIEEIKTAITQERALIDKLLENIKTTISSPPSPPPALKL